MNQEQPIIVGLDIGTTKIAAIATSETTIKKADCRLPFWVNQSHLLEQSLKQLAHFRRIARHGETTLFHDGQLGIGRIGTARNQRTSVTHAFAGRSA